MQLALGPLVYREYLDNQNLIKIKD